MARLGRDCSVNLLVGAAVDALSAADARRLERHLCRCAACRAELEAYRDVAGLLALALPLLDPPITLRTRVRAATGTGVALVMPPRPGLVAHHTA